MMGSDDLNRRNFLTNSAAGAAALSLSAASASRAATANDRINIGIIGCGGRGQALMNQIHGLQQDHNVRITTLCDVWKINADQAAETVKTWYGTKPIVTSKFREVLTSKNVDAVVIATPDFAHSPILIEAVRAGKDAYCEKPMSNTLAEAKGALQAVQETGRVVQIGTQRRSDGRHMEARRWLSQDVIGKVTRVQAEFNFNHPRWARAYGNVKADDVDWAQFLMGKPMRPFDPRMLRQWHLYKEFTTGLSGLWMVHLVDACHMMMGESYPTTAMANGGTWVWTEGREHCDTFEALLTYPKGFMFSFAMSLCNSAGGRYAIYGTDGTLDCQNWTISGAGGGKGKLDKEIKIGSQGGADHMANFLSCLRSREKPNADIEAGYAHAVACIMTAHSLWSGRRKTYDARAREIRDA